MLDLPLLSATMRDCGHKLPKTDNIGKSNDWRDLYYLTDYLTFALDRTYETQPCRAGCSLCCRENSVFRVSVVEWQVIEAFLEQQEAAWVAALIERNETLYGGHWEKLQSVADYWERNPMQGGANPYLDGLPSLCPALVDDRCSMYEARPLVCRAYGYFGWKGDTLLICKTYGQGFLDSLKEQGLANAPLPNFEPFVRQAQRLNSTLVNKPLPLWLHEWARSRLPDTE